MECFRNVSPEPFTAGVFSDVYDFPEQNIVVKELRGFWQLSRELDYEYTFENFKREVTDIASVLRKPKFGLAPFIPRYLPVWSKDKEGNEAGYIVMEKVNGKDLHDCKPTDININMAEQLDELIAGCLKIGSENIYLDENVRIMPDIMTHAFLSSPDESIFFTNIMIGNINGKRKPYLVDIYPAVRYDEGMAPEYEEYLESSYILTALTNLSKMSHGYPYKKTSTMLSEYRIKRLEYLGKKSEIRG